MSATSTQFLPTQQQHGVDYQEHGGDHRRAEQVAKELLQQKADDDRGDGGDHDQCEHAPAFAGLVC